MQEEYYELLRDEKDLLHTEIDMYKSSIADKEEELKRKDEAYNTLWVSYKPTCISTWLLHGSY